MLRPYIIGLDIGGSHVSGAVIDMHRKELLADTYKNVSVNTKASSEDILNTWAALINIILSKINERDLQGISIAVPGPFDYKKGVFLIKGLDKYDGCYGIQVMESLKNRLHLSNNDIPVIFNNDAHCFATGEAVCGVAKNYLKVIGITLGTGFGAAFYSSDTIITEGEGVPKNGELYNEPFKEGMAEDYISARWFLKAYRQQTGEELPGVKELYDRADKDAIAKNLFEEFGKNLAQVLLPFILSFQAECIVLGGNISKAKKYFLPSLQRQFEKNNLKIKVLFSSLGEKAAIMGSAEMALKRMQSQNDIQQKYVRKTNQFLVPAEKPFVNNSYDIYPAFPLSGNFMGIGYTALAEAIKNKHTIIIEGFSGVFWDELIASLNAAFVGQNKKVTWYDSAAAFKSEEEINKILEPYLGGDDPLFGKIYPGELIDFFDIDKLEAFRISAGADINIIYGCGSSLIAKEGFLIYADVPKNEIQFRSRAGRITNLGVSSAYHAPKEMYKRFYYIDWIVLNKHKKSLLPFINIIADTQRPGNPVFTDGHSLRNTLTAMTKSVVRARPWFEPGVWGGQWIKEKIGQLNQEEVNYAWSFELITPENGVMLQSKNILLEVPFDFLMYHDNEAVSGDAAKRFGDEFPIRFDFLDTFNGGNLSLQCHPSTNYIKENFGENYTQDETYYILDCAEDACVYLGFQDDINSNTFKEKLEESFETNKEVDVEKFVQKIPANKHDLFLIPNGTIHCSGVNNLVLEISSTPYIYTFKMYDWLRDDLEGNPRPLNIERAFDNLCFERKGRKVEKELISKPYKYSEGKGWECYHLPTHNEHFYDIYRYHIQPLSKAEINTAKQCHIMSLAEGEQVVVQTRNNYSAVFHYAETFFVPAAAEKYSLENTAGNIIQVIVAFCKPEKYQ